MWVLSLSPIQLFFLISWARPFLAGVEKIIVPFFFNILLKDLKTSSNWESFKCSITCKDIIISKDLFLIIFKSLIIVEFEFFFAAFIAYSLIS